MFTLVATWNLARPDQENLADFQSVQRRGYNSELVSLTGQLVNKVAEKTILPLSVSDIADKRCNARRDLYLRKGVARLTATELRRIEKPTWGQKAGNFVQKYVEGVGVYEGLGGRQSYAVTRNNGDGYHNAFVQGNVPGIDKLRALENTPASSAPGDTDWLLRLLKCNGKLELGTRALDTYAREEGDVDFSHVKFKARLIPKTREIGISSPATPDFIIPRQSIVGDVKTGIAFEAHFQLTCAGYALAYESELGQDHDMNWGFIYLITTRNPSAFVRPLTFAQLYIFAVDDNLRTWFLSERDTSYRILAENQIPIVKEEDLLKNCPYCKYKVFCEQ
ncbi:MAG: CRISPR-associated protein Cas4 [Dehalococcoidia bacterium]|nr:CRISPR-associated protein Cas4 [Dehalococcoidia bacterium]